MSSNSPLVSVITPVYNAEKYLETMINSVMSQTYENWELILVDDCSTDQSVAIIRHFVNADSRIHLLQNEVNQGAGNTRNRAIEHAKGRYIAFLDSDDIWASTKLDVQISVMMRGNIAFSHTSYGYIDETGRKIKDTFHVSAHPVGYYDLLKRTEISCLTAVYDASLIGKFYMSAHRRKQDYALWLSILKTGIKSEPIDVELAYYRQHAGSATSNKVKLIKGHISFLMSTQNMNIFTALYYTLHWMLNGFIRYYIK